MGQAHLQVEFSDPQQAEQVRAANRLTLDLFRDAYDSIRLISAPAQLALDNGCAMKEVEATISAGESLIFLTQ